MNLPDAKALCENYLLGNGADSFWYWDVGAFVFAGDETTAFTSGKDYKVTDKTVQENDIIMIGLSPQKDDIWGNYSSGSSMARAIKAHSEQGVVFSLFYPVIRDKKGDLRIFSSPYFAHKQRNPGRIATI